jgi:hypothetical protein
MITAYLLYTGPDGHSHVTPGRITPEVPVDSTSIQFKECPPVSHLLFWQKIMGKAL